ncbi:MAG: hypothetical protein ABI598_05280 [Chloroflexota bacterium]
MRDREAVPTLAGAPDSSAATAGPSSDLIVVDTWRDRRTLFGELDR